VRAVEQFPLIINLTVTESLFLANWGQTAKTILALALASILALLTAAHFLLRMARERDASMVVLTQQADQLQQAAGVFTHAREGITITSLDGQILDVNAAFTQITGFERDEVIGRKPSMLSSGRHDKAFFETMWKTLLSDGHWSGEIWNRRKNGELYVEMLTISTVRDAHGIPQRFVALFSDITVAKAHQYQLEHIAHFDALTGLPNRVLLGDRLGQALLQTQRRKRLLAVAYIDLDGFKQVNDTYGHAEGDQLLITVTQRMKQVLREGDTLARLGGDEFVAILADLSEAAACTNTLSRLLEAVAQPVRLGNNDASVSASMGVTFYPQANEVDADMLLRQSDQAMYQAKLAGKSRFHFFDIAQSQH
jgi:diguanylate cyclase (GGDEF)-like protein/PAS domain S-box-containing protein